MEEFKKPEHLVIDAIPYLTKIMDKGLIKDLQEDEVICPNCHGTGLTVYDAPYGLSNDPDKKLGMFPYKHQSISTCQNCFNGVLKVCSHCGKQLTRRDYKCDCDETISERIQKELEKEQERFNKSIKLNASDDKVKEMEYLYSENYGHNEGYFNEWEDFFEYWDNNYDRDEIKPTYVWGTTTEKIAIDVNNIIEMATEELYEDAIESIDDSDIEELQEYLDKWCEKQDGTTTYSMTCKYSVFIPWDKYNVSN